MKKTKGIVNSNNLYRSFSTLPFHWLLFAIFPILFFYSNNIKELSLDVLVAPIFYTIVIATIIYLVLTFLLKNLHKAAAVSSLFFVLFFSFGHVKTFFHAQDRFLLLIWLIFLITGLYLLLKTSRNLVRLTNLLNIASVFLVVFSLANISYFEIANGRIFKFSENNPSNTQNTLAKLKKPENAPDIYYFIFDRYASFGTLKDLYNYKDISEFESYLTKKGFYIPTYGYANYPRTFLSLASSLNMGYVNYLTGQLGENSGDEATAYKLLKNYKVQALLKSVGYKYIHVGSWWEPTRQNDSADKNFFYSPFRFRGLSLDEFSTKLIETTLASEFLSRTSVQGTIEPLYGRTNHRESILFQFKTLEEEVIPSKGPKFVFAHLLVPHPPYVLDENCTLITEQDTEKRKESDNYLNQLACTNKKIKTLINKIQTESKGSAIIILQADEGPEGVKNKLSQKWQESSIDAIREKTGILNAYYLPGKSKNDLYPSITPVNTFRKIFNLYFGANFDILEDKVYVVESKEHPYKMFDVTEKLR
ncbi:MAG: sulfatase-like hydrolase/transferase [bacterium]|nr:sulfatase-like hydrolase/transferase [bacterium]